MTVANRPEHGPKRDTYIVYGHDEVGLSFVHMAGEPGIVAERVRQVYWLRPYRDQRMRRNLQSETDGNC